MLVVAAGIAIVAARGGVHGWYVTPGWKLIWKKEGASVAVSVEESPEGLRRLRTNNNFTEGGDAGGLSQIRQGLLPTLLVPDAARVLALGVGSGITLAGTVAGAPDAFVDAVELIPEIGRAVGFFGRTNGSVGKLPNVALHVADARTFTAHAAAQGATYDVVVGELFHASQAGTGALYAAEHFANVRRLLTPGRGVYCQWIPLHEAPPREVKAVVRTFFRAFPHGAAFFGSWTMRTPILGLIGTERPLQLGWDAYQRVVAQPPSRRARAEASELARVPETMAAFIGDAAIMRRWAGDGALNSDDRPTLELGAPRGAGRPLGPENVIALLSAWGPPDGIVRYGTAERRAEVMRLQAALFAFFRGNEAWLAGDLERAAQELLRAQGLARELRFIEPALRGLAATWRAMGNPERAAALERALAR